MGAVEVTHGHELPGAARPAATLAPPVILVGAATAGAVISPASATAAATAAGRAQYLRPRNKTRLTSAPAISPPYNALASRPKAAAQTIHCTSATARQDQTTVSCPGSHASYVRRRRPEHDAGNEK
jgi:hypothetical protein